MCSMKSREVLRLLLNVFRESSLYVVVVSRSTDYVH